MTADAALGMAIIALAGVIIVIRQNRPRIA
jgi:hypothetical protein